MKFRNNCPYFLLFVLLIATNIIVAQDSIPNNTAVDSIHIDTTVIRAEIFKVRYIPRGVNLVNPKISYKSTKPLDKRFKRFRVPSFWERINKIGLNVSEVAFVNWNAGGNSSVSGIINGKFERNYKFRYVQWDNLLELRYGANVQEDQKPRKTDDAIRFSSTFGYRSSRVMRSSVIVTSYIQNFNTGRVQK